LAFGQVGEKTAFESVYNNNTQIDTTGDKNQANFLISNIDNRWLMPTRECSVLYALKI
jgi:hypothetical protein